MNIFISSLYKRYVGVQIVRVSFNLDYAVIKNRLAFNVQDIYHFRHFVRQNPITLKTLVAVSFFLDVLLSFSLIFLITISALNITSFANFICSFNTNISYDVSVHAVEQ